MLVLGLFLHDLLVVFEILLLLIFVYLCSVIFAFPKSLVMEVDVFLEAIFASVEVLAHFYFIYL